MTTRKTSLDVQYPFVPELTAGELVATRGILDVFMIIQPPLSYEPIEATSSSFMVSRSVRLVSYNVSGSITTFRFTAMDRGVVWSIVFDVPNNTETIGIIKNTSPEYVQAVLTYNSCVGVGIPRSGSDDVDILLEPSRAQWHLERVTDISFFNIARCNGSETSSDLLPLTEDLVSSSSSSPASKESSSYIKLINGWNCELTFDDESCELFVNGGIGLGQGIATDFGNTLRDCPDIDTDFVSTINGLFPINGDIAISVSPGLGKVREAGRIVISSRQ